MPGERTRIEKGAEDAPVASENAGPLAFAALGYRGVLGAWPASVEDLEKFYGGAAFELDWRELRGALLFEELPDGRLRITPKNPCSHFTVTVDIPANKKTGRRGQSATLENEKAENGDSHRF
jgi:hypothetical protein